MSLIDKADKESNLSFLVADDHPMVRAGIISLLKGFYKGSKFTDAYDIQGAIKVLEEEVIDCALLDYKMGSEHIITLIPKIKSEYPNTKMLVVSMMDELGVGVACIKAGAHGFLSKAANPDEVANAVETVLAGRVYASIELSNLLMKPEKQFSSIAELSNRETEVFSLLGSGLKVSKIAERLGVSVRTIESHRDHIKDKLGCETSAHLVIMASKWLDRGC